MCRQLYYRKFSRNEVGFLEPRASFQSYLFRFINLKLFPFLGLDITDVTSGIRTVESAGTRSRPLRPSDVKG